MSADPDVPLAIQVWAATHYERLDARECSLRYGIPKPRVRALLAEYRPVADNAEFELSKARGIPDPEQPAKLARQRVAGARRRAAAKQKKDADHDAG